MLQGIDPLLTGQLLMHLDQMGHSDVVAVVDAHFPARRLATRCVELPGVGTPILVRAIRSVLPLDDVDGVRVMATPDSETLAIHDRIAEAASVASRDLVFVDRFKFYELAERAFVIIRTGETATYGNAALAKGLVTR
jgi:L-fucose mutarotase